MGKMALRFALGNALFASLIFLVAGCSSVSLPSLPSWPWSSPASQPNATAEALFEEGAAYFNNKKYPLAIDRFQKVRAEFPFSPQLILAELKLAEAYYLNKQYPEAAAAFKEFQTLHPSNENIPFVVYHLGLVHFEQFTGTDRYQKITEIAKDYFATVVKNYPSSPYAGQAKEKLAKCLDYLSEYEFNIATFYFNEKRYSAAIDRFEGILSRYRDTSFAVKALYYLGESHRLEKNSVKAALAYEALVQHYPNDPLAKAAQQQLSDLAKEKQDPLAILLKKDGRARLAPPPLPPRATASREPGAAGREKELNLVAKKEVVHEEPGDEKGVFRRVVDTLNPFGSAAGKKENGSKNIATAKEESTKEQSTSFFGSLWRGLNPFATGDNTKLTAPIDPKLVGKVDESLNQKGIDTRAQNLASKAPASDLPKVEESAPPPTDITELVGGIDSNLKREGKNVADLPPPPEPSPVFRVSTTEEKKPAVSRSETVSPSANKGLVAGIDEALKRKGVDPAKLETTAKSAEVKTESQGPSRQTPAVRTQEKVELAPKLPLEKGPLFLDTGEYQAQEKAKGDQSSEQVVTQPTKNVEPPRELPQAVTRSPQAVREKAAETQASEKKKSSDAEEESKGAFDQLKEDFGRLRDLLNPFGR